jgi:HD superfamily phosphodiesterase
MEVVRHLQKPLKAFVHSVMDSELGERFLRQPASRNHHHSEPGGIFWHSYEVVQMVIPTAQRYLSSVEAQVTIVGAFFHDIGKCARSGGFVRHDALTLEVLAPHLAKLEEEWPIAANLLRSIWTRSTGYQGQFPAFPGTILVQAADQFSTALDQRKKMFAGRRSSNPMAYGEAHRQWYLRMPI